MQAYEKTDVQGIYKVLNKYSSSYVIDKNNYILSNTSDLELDGSDIIKTKNCYRGVVGVKGCSYHLVTEHSGDLIGYIYRVGNILFMHKIGSVWGIRTALKDRLFYINNLLNNTGLDTFNKLLVIRNILYKQGLTNWLNLPNGNFLLKQGKTFVEFNKSLIKV